MSRYRSEVLDWFDSGRVAAGREEAVLRSAQLMPTRLEWRRFLSNLCLWLGTVALAAAIIFFFAFNWDDLGRYAKFALLEAAILVTLAAVVWLDLDGMAGKAALMACALLVGALLALTGQVYQTGADSYELFAWWAVLITPWAVLARFTPMWVLWLVLLNLAVSFFFSRGIENEGLLWTLFFLNALLMAAWEWARRVGIHGIGNFWLPRLAAMVGGTAVTMLGMTAVFGETNILGLIAWLLWIGAIYHWYRKVRFDLFMLAGGVLSVIVVVTALLSQKIFESGSAGFLIVGLAVIGMAGGGAAWLRRIGREQAA